jgi:hypothetical protein
MSFVCCEKSPVALTTCAVTYLTASAETANYTSPDAVIDVSRAPYRRVCLHADAPITVQETGDSDIPEVQVTLWLYRVGVDTALDSSAVSFSLGAFDSGTATPSLQLTVEPGRYRVYVQVQARLGDQVIVQGRINVSTCVVSIPA